MSLFSANDVLKQPASDSQGFDGFVHFKAKTRAILSRNRQRLEDNLGTITQGTDIRFVNGARWSAHDLLFYVLSQTGSAKVWIATWAIGEAAVRLLYQAKEQGLISELYGIFDRRLPIRKPKTAQFIRNLCVQSVLCDCHAKMFVIENDEWNISCVMTCNFSNNKRIEAGYLSTQKEIADFDKAWMEMQLRGEDVFNWKR